MPNAKWSDGKPLTSADVAFTLNTIIKYQTGATALDEAYVTGMKNVTTPDPVTAVVHYKGPVATVLAYLDQVPIVPQHIWQKVAGVTAPVSSRSRTARPSWLRPVRPGVPEQQ